ncbi:MAG TPA: AbrB/MazE/SpoVT family DNA-binding domain-containing protein [Candidatus Aquilonibacter sp.]|nr:AbrB/MazE/SpoVT family DNA-binding domain-containing protein [Candidatus Aquilonibacter sp.]
MKSVVKKWGNSASIRIPKSVMRAARLKLDDAVEIKEESGRIIIESADQPEYDLDELVRRITPKNRHKEVDFGRPVGKEFR